MDQRATTADIAGRTGGESCKGGASLEILPEFMPRLVRFHSFHPSSRKV